MLGVEPRLETSTTEGIVIILGLVLAIAGALLDIGILVTLGVILIVVGVIFWILGALDRPVLGRRYYY
jgi:hypothetical protein